MVSRKDEHHVTAWIPKEIVDKLDELAKLHHRTRQAELIIACERYVQGYGDDDTERFIAFLKSDDGKQLVRELVKQVQDEMEES